MTPPDRAPEPLSVEEEAEYREALTDIRSPYDEPWEPTSAVEATRRLWADRCRRLLATLDAARDSRPVGEGLREALTRLGDCEEALTTVERAYERDTARSIRENDLPSRVVVGANGAYWRDYDDGYSMCPVSDDNDPVVPVAIYVRARWSEASRRLATDQPASTEAGE